MGNINHVGDNHPRVGEGRVERRRGRPPNGAVSPLIGPSGEARAALPQILDRVRAGEEVTITRHGEPVAVVVRPDTLRVRRADRALFPTESTTETGAVAGTGSVLLIPELFMKPMRDHAEAEIEALAVLLARLDLRPADQAIAEIEITHPGDLPEP